MFSIKLPYMFIDKKLISK